MYAPIAVLMILLTGADAEGSFHVRDLINRRWTNELVTFSIPSRSVDAASTVLLDETGNAIAAQFSQQPEGPCEVSFLLDDLPACGARTFRLAPGTPASRVLVRPDADWLVLDGGNVGARVPEEGRQEFDTPVALSTLPPPLEAIRGASGAWLGTGMMLGDYPVTSLRSDIVVDGPVYAQSRTTYNFVHGYYTMDVRVVHGLDAVFVFESFDIPADAAERAWYAYDFQTGLQPDRVAAEIRKWRQRTDDRTNVLGSDYALDFDEARRELSVVGYINWWPETAMRASFYRSGKLEGDFITVLPARIGLWRNPTPLHAMTQPGGHVHLKAPIFRDAQFGGVELDSPYYTGKIEEGWPLTATRRQWVLHCTTLGEALPAQGRSSVLEATRKYGSLPLDKVKDWVLDWHDSPDVRYPRLFVSPGTLPAIRARATAYDRWKDRFPAGGNSVAAYLITGDPGVIDRLVFQGDPNSDAPYCYEQMGILQSLRQHTRICMDYGYAGEHWMTTAPNNSRPLHEMIKFDAAMCIPDLDPAVRVELRRHMAFLCNVVYDQDWNPTLAGFHRGNVNMPPRQEHHLAVAGCVLPGHPLASAWRERGAAEQDKILGYMVREGGAWRECPSYQVDAAYFPLCQAALAVRNSGGRDLFTDPRLKASWDYLLALCTPPDPRFGVRVIPPFGNGSWLRSALWGWLASATRDTDPAFSARMQWMWQEQGREDSYAQSELIIDPGAAAEMPKLESKAFPGFGAVLRSGFPAADESWLAYHCGENDEHYCTGDQGSFIWYAKGAPLVVHFGSIYQPQFRGAWYFNRVCVNHREIRDGLMGGTEFWPGEGEHRYTGDVVDFQRVGPVDYCVGRHHWEAQGLWPDGARVAMPHNQDPPRIDIPPHTWTRQLAMVKSLSAHGAEDASGPTYLVMRDSFASLDPLPSEWNLWFNASRIDLDENRARVYTPHGVIVDVYMVTPVEPQWLLRTDSDEYVKFDNTPETYTNLRAHQVAGAEFLAILFPRKESEPEPEFRTLPDGEGVNVRHSRGTDTVLFSNVPRDWRVDAVTIHGRTAIIREEDGKRSVNLLAPGYITPKTVVEGD